MEVSARGSLIGQVGATATTFAERSVVYSGIKYTASTVAESLRREIGKDGIRITCIEAGAVKTEFVSQRGREITLTVSIRRSMNIDWLVRMAAPQ